MPARRTTQLVKTALAEQLTLLESNSGVYLFWIWLGGFGGFFLFVCFFAAIPLLPRMELLRDHKILMLHKDRADIHQPMQRFAGPVLGFEKL